jgi:hypothetical protein
MKEKHVLWRKRNIASRYRVFFVFALVFLVGCDPLKDLANQIPSDIPGGGRGNPVAGAAEIPSIKGKFGVSSTGTEGVKRTFLELHAYIRKGGLNSASTVIRLGDYIDLEGGLTVEAYPIGTTKGRFALDAESAMQPMVTEDGAVPWGRLCRLIVVGINSFKDGGSDGMSPYIYEGNDEPPAHVVFQFQNIPILRDADKTPEPETGGWWPTSGVDDTPAANGIQGNFMPVANVDGIQRMILPAEPEEGVPGIIGYAVGEIRRYLTPVYGDDASGRFLAGLQEAGVPEEVIWAPSRVFPQGSGNPVIIADKLWLPLRWEMSDTSERSAIMARLEYYTNNASREKLWYGDPVGWTSGLIGMGHRQSYWLAATTSFFKEDFIYYEGSVYKGSYNGNAGVVPAFCVY